MFTLGLFGTVLVVGNFDFSILDFLVDPVSHGAGVDFMFFLIDHGEEFLFCLLYFFEPLIS